MKAHSLTALVWIGVMTAAVTGSGCASGYILNTRPAPKWYQALPFFPQLREKATIPSEAGLSLHYDRTELVRYEDPQLDGTVWVHYALIVKNSNAASAQILAREVALVAENVPTAVPIDQIPKGALNPDGTPYEPPVTSSLLPIFDEISLLRDELLLSQSADEKPDPAKGTPAASAPAAAAAPASSQEAAAQAKPKEPPKKAILKTHRAVAIYRPEDGVTPQIPVAGKAYFRLPISFRIQPEVAKFLGNSEKPVHLTVGFSNGKTLKLPLWLWRRK